MIVRGFFYNVSFEKRRSTFAFTILISIPMTILSLIYPRTRCMYERLYACMYVCMYVCVYVPRSRIRGGLVLDIAN